MSADELPPNPSRRPVCCGTPKVAVWDNSEPGTPRLAGWECRRCVRGPGQRTLALAERERELVSLRRNVPVWEETAATARRVEDQERFGRLAQNGAARLKELEDEDQGE